VRRELERIEIPDEHESRERSWTVISAAFTEREPHARRRSWKPVVAIAVALVVVAGLLSPPGMAVLDELRQAVAIESESTAVVTLPSGGRVLVAAEGGTWIVKPDGSRRRLGAYTSATWSPRGLFVAVSSGAGLTALDPQGNVRWSLPRTRVVWPTWAPSGFRIAYLADGRLRVVAGDGTGDRVLAANVGPNAPAWEPAIDTHVLAYSDRAGRIHVVDTDSRRRRWRSAPGDLNIQLEWSSDGTRLLALGARNLRIFQGNGELLRTIPTGGAPASVAFRRKGHSFAFAHRIDGARSEVVLVPAERTGGLRSMFRGAGAFGEIAWSPDGKWLLVPWPSADQWVFVRSGKPPKIITESEITRYFSPDDPGAVFPTLSGWCCAG
jgi:Tol biopolymer transport system component